MGNAGIEERVGFGNFDDFFSEYFESLVLNIVR